MACRARDQSGLVCPGKKQSQRCAKHTAIDAKSLDVNARGGPQYCRQYQMRVGTEGGRKQCKSGTENTLPLVFTLHERLFEIRR